MGVAVTCPRLHWPQRSTAAGKPRDHLQRGDPGTVSHYRRARGLVTLTLLLLASLPLAPSAWAGTNDTITSFSLSGSPFAEDFAPLPQQVEARLVTSRQAKVTVRVYRLDGTAVRTFARLLKLPAGEYAWSWDGRTAAGVAVPDGVYEIRARAANPIGVAIERRHVRKGMPAIFPANPGAIVIVVDPGHGGRLPGACYLGYCEKTFNLDISLQLQALLQRAGVTVVMTRTTDTAVDQPASDRNADGLTNGYDDLVARNDIANLARGDINIHIHNNAYGCRCTRGTQTFTNYFQPWSPAGIELATIMQREQLATLDQFRAGGYFPFDRGIKNGNYHYMTPYAVSCPTAGSRSDCSPPYQPRPVMMPSVLSESLFVNNDLEFELLKRADVRLALASSFYLAMAEYLSNRQLGIGYELLNGPDQPVTAGSQVSYGIRVTNRGNTPSSGWTLELHDVPAVPLYDGSGQLGNFMGSVVVPDGLQPGASVDLTIAGAAPAEAGDWLVKSDVRLADDSYASSAGVVSMQMPLTTTTP